MRGWIDRALPDREQREQLRGPAMTTDGWKALGTYLRFPAGDQHEHLRKIAVMRGWIDRALPDPAQREQLRKLAMILPNIVKLLARLARDPRVPTRAKIFAAGAVAYLVSPVDLIPDFLPVIGKTDDIVVVALALDCLIEEAGLATVREHWDGSDETLSFVVDVVGMVAGLVPRAVRIVVNRYLRGG